MTEKPMNPYRKQAVDWLRDFANLAEGKAVNGVDGDPSADSRALALRVAAQQIEGLPDPSGADTGDWMASPEPTMRADRTETTDRQPEASETHIDPSGDVSQQIAAKSDEEMDHAMAASVPPEPVQDEDF